jgi:hypothetical protein
VSNILHNGFENLTRRGAVLGSLRRVDGNPYWKELLGSSRASE